MALLTKQEFELYENIIALNQTDMRLVMSDYLKKRYKNVRQTEDFIYAVGDIPIALVAHLDTVFEEETKPFKITGTTATYKKPARKPILYYDQWKEQIGCPQGAGFDDRAGVYAIFKILESGLRPSVILTTDEEIGGVGARIFVNTFTTPLSELNYIIQLDRRGIQDCVFYDLEYKEFETYIESFGFKTNIGSFSDISTICPAWGVAGVNLSIGYFNEHSTEEYLDVAAWLATIDKVKMMLSETDIPFWKYIESKSYAYGYPYDYPYDAWDMYPWGSDSEYMVPCQHCKKEFDIFDTQPVLNKEGKAEYYCYNCYGKMKKCENCGDMFYRKNPRWTRCKSCAKEAKSRFGNDKGNNNK